MKVTKTEIQTKICVLFKEIGPNTPCDSLYTLLKEQKVKEDSIDAIRCAIVDTLTTYLRHAAIQKPSIITDEEFNTFMEFAMGSMAIQEKRRGVSGMKGCVNTIMQTCWAQMKQEKEPVAVAPAQSSPLSTAAMPLPASVSPLAKDTQPEAKVLAETAKSKKPSQLTKVELKKIIDSQFGPTIQNNELSKLLEECNAIQYLSRIQVAIQDTLNWKITAASEWDFVEEAEFSRALTNASRVITQQFAAHIPNIETVTQYVQELMIKNWSLPTTPAVVQPVTLSTAGNAVTKKSPPPPPAVSSSAATPQPSVVVSATVPTVSTVRRLPPPPPPC